MYFLGIIAGIMKYIIICLDGMSDHPVEILGGKTPVQVAQTPNLDRLVQQGVVGAMQNTPPGLKAGSDVCNLSLLGYDCVGFYSGRAPYEAASMGIEQQEHEVVFRCNLVNIVDEIMVDFSAGHIDSSTAAPLIEVLNQELSEEGLRFYPGIGYRHILLIDTRKYTYDFKKLNCTPPHDIMGQNVEVHWPKGEGEELIDRLMRASQTVLAKYPNNQGCEYPANSIWLWGQGVKPEVEPFFDKFGLRGSVISAVDLVRGIGQLAQLDVLNVPGITGYYDTDYAAKGCYAIDSLNDKDFIFVHIEATDEAGHNGDHVEKVRAIKNADAKVIGPLMEAMEGREYRMLVAPDHPTPVALRTHTEEYVPFVMAGTGIEQDGCRPYDENILTAQDVPRYDRGHKLIAEFLAP